jgi:hypothetical protein
MTAAANVARASRCYGGTQEWRIAICRGAWRRLSAYTPATNCCMHLYRSGGLPAQNSVRRRGSRRGIAALQAARAAGVRSAHNIGLRLPCRARAAAPRHPLPAGCQQRAHGETSRRTR